MGSLYSPQKEVALGLRAAIILVPYLATWILLKEGYSTRARILGFGWLAFFLFILLPPMMREMNGGPGPFEAVATQEPAPEAETPKPRVTARQFALLTPGRATYAFVESLWGPGELGAASNDAGVKTEVYTWTNPDGGMMQLTFQNDQLAVKVQAGLQ